MALVDRTKVHRRGMAAIAAARVVTVLAVAGSGPPWAAAQPTASPAEASARHQSEGAASDAHNTAPVITEAHGLLLGHGEFTPIDTPGPPRTPTQPLAPTAARWWAPSTPPAPPTAFYETSTASSPPSLFPALYSPPPLGIHNHGQIVGPYLDADGVAHRFVRDQGAHTPLDPSGGRPFPTASAINDCGQMVGCYVDANDRARGLLRDQQGFTPMDVPDAVLTVPCTINNYGQIVGLFSDG
jgi:hypothetical protein